VELVSVKFIGGRRSGAGIHVIASW